VVAYVSELSLELARGALQRGRALLAAARNWTLCTWERDARGGHPRAVVEAIDPEALGIDPLLYR
jgi:hypothetical protein